jgi:hypothetical protein
VSEGGLMQHDDADLRRALGSRSLWLGAVSFEDRSLASLRYIRHEGFGLLRGIALDYEGGSGEGHYQAGSGKRRENWKALEELAPQVFRDGFERRAVEPYIFDDLRIVLEELLGVAEIEWLLIDLSCLTTIHTLAVGAVIATMNLQAKCILLHTAPLNYGFIDEEQSDRTAWKDILIAPLAETAGLFYESHGRGIVLLGPEPERLIVGISEIEPSGGTIVAPEFEGRPDLSYFVKRRNLKMVRQLARLPVKAWREKVVAACDLSGLARHVRDEVQQASKKKAPAILFPFGPKPFAVASAYLMARYYPQSAWFVYPIPSSYDIEVTYGTAEIFSFRLEVERESQERPTRRLRR